MRESPSLEKTLLDGGLYPYGGYGYTGPQNSTELYDPSARAWISTGNMNAALGYHTVSTLPNGQVLVAGGQSHET
ncbi:unnamed protein product [Didymodactylos carnosus]|uniref:Uncharacterized protein n=1 Tax=Didymodactylos carnosus TaxID=1234261 RepID=A0A813W200_9BILA|nr:unnamed protein product [Didymodactylos carnosus]CAF3632025.1 unnamed protein product [Didymodactylos carnosus]